MKLGKSRNDAMIVIIAAFLLNYEPTSAVNFSMLLVRHFELLQTEVYSRAVQTYFKNLGFLIFLNIKNVKSENFRFFNVSSQNVYFSSLNL